MIATTATMIIRMTVLLVGMARIPGRMSHEELIPFHCTKDH
jgi:hypothetical protein